MGEAKEREKQRPVTSRLDFTHKELGTLAIFLLQNVKPKNRSERKRYEALFDELRVDHIVEKIDSGEGLKLAELNEPGTIYREVSRSALEYLRECLDAETAGLQTLILGRIDKRVCKAIEGEYVAPDEARSNGATEPKTATPEAL